MSKRLIITRIVTSSSETKFDDEFYPGMTLQEAIELEKNSEPSEWGEYFFEENCVADIKTFVEIVEEDD